MAVYYPALLAATSNQPHLHPDMTGWARWPQPTTGGLDSVDISPEVNSWRLTKDSRGSAKLPSAAITESAERLPGVAEILSTSEDVIFVESGSSQGTAFWHQAASWSPSAAVRKSSYFGADRSLHEQVRTEQGLSSKERALPAPLQHVGSAPAAQPYSERRRNPVPLKPEEGAPGPGVLSDSLPLGSSHHRQPRGLASASQSVGNREPLIVQLQELRHQAQPLVQEFQKSDSHSGLGQSMHGILEGFGRSGLNPERPSPQQTSTGNSGSAEAGAASRSLLGRRQYSRRQYWTPEEDELLRTLVASLGPTDWPSLSAKMPGRSSKQCRERWLNHLQPSAHKSAWTAEEDALIAQLHSQHGNKWRLIAQYVPGRSDNDIKNRFHVTLRRLKKEQRGEFSDLDSAFMAEKRSSFQ
ncbi:Transcriptional activator Myb [Porphyridium purpureum]|uniref:Transcriptional activator Myb n=1 Tax=Porphyridium purpureum TaxID=35688 RepID=A0A5J4Z4Z3_PORPP|nr:Transcriptional activator Myb [Porphyridium purpureum]|eukprot:POR9167..scf295_1